MIKTEIKETLNGHTVTFTIDNQTFSLQECEPEEEMSSEEYAKWYKRNLDVAFEKIQKIIIDKNSHIKNMGELLNKAKTYLEYFNSTTAHHHNTEIQELISLINKHIDK